MKINTKKIGLIVFLCLFLFPFFTSFMRPAIEGSAIPNDIAGLNSSSSADFYAISESDLTTRWILQNASLTPVENFHDDINTDYWNLVDVSSLYFEEWLSDSSNYLLDNVSLYTGEVQYTGTHWDTGGQSTTAEGITWDGTHFWVLAGDGDEVYKYTEAGVYTGTHWDAGAQSNAMSGITWDGTYFWLVTLHDDVYKYNATGSYMGFTFDTSAQDVESEGICWDGTGLWVVGDDTNKAYKYDIAGNYLNVNFSIPNEPRGMTWDGGDYFWICQDWAPQEYIYRYTTAGVYTGTKLNTVSENNYVTGVVWADNHVWVVGYSNDEVYKYEVQYNISKNYFGSGYTYIQTDTTEGIGLQSIDYTTHYNLSSGDYFEVDFQTSSDSQINLILLKDGVVNKTLTLSQSGNTNFNRHTAQISVDEDVEFDQLKINSTFEDKDYIKVYDIKTYKYTLVGDYADFYVGSRRTHSVNLTSGIYNLRIFEESTKKMDVNITIGMTDYFYIYTPIETLDSRLTLFDPEGNHLDFTDYHISINRSLNGEWNIFDLLDNIFIADEETYVYINVSDRFDSLIDSFEKLSASYIDIELEVYSLQIKNLMEQETTIDINATHVYPLLYGESKNFMLAKNYYQIGFYDEYNLYNNFTIYLNSNQAYQLNSSLKTIYFSMFTYDGLGINHDLVRFYINGARKDFGFNSMLDDSLELVILDFFNNTLANETIDANAYDNSEYNLYVQVYSMYILNQFTYRDLIMNITQVGSGYNMTQLIPASSALLYRFIPNINYTINATYVNGTMYSIRTVNLTENSQISSFGVSSEPEEYPKDVYFSIYNYDGLGLEFNLFKFYIDGDRTDFGFNRIENQIIHLEVKDFFDYILFDEYINTSGIYEYNIEVNVYTVMLVNNYNRTIQVEIERGSVSTMVLLGSRSGITLKLLPNVEYEFIALENDGEEIEKTEIVLSEDNLIVDFGFYEEDLPVDPEPILLGVEEILLSFLFYLGVGIVGMILFIKLIKEPKRKRRNSYNQRRR